MPDRPYGYELIVDLHECKLFDSLKNRRITRKNLRQFFRELCKLIKVKPCNIEWFDYEEEPSENYAKAPDRLKGISAVQFILTSNITVHALDALGYTYVNVFSCDKFDAKEALKFIKEWFDGDIVHWDFMERK